MRTSRLWKPIIRTAPAAAVVLAGCGPPPGTAPILRHTVETVTLRRAGQPLAREPLFTSWLPDVGRMGEEVRRRHLPPDPGWANVLAEEFREAATEVVPGWRIVDFPSLKIATLNGRRSIEIRGPADMKAPCGLECDLSAASLTGRDARLDWCLSCRSPQQAEAIQGIRITVTAGGDAGQSTSITVPLQSGVSPGWEWQHAWLRFESGMRSATLRIVAERPGAAVTLGAVRLAARRSAQPGNPPSIDSAATQAAGHTGSQARNWLVGGSFETGSSGFYASAVTRWPNGGERVIPIDWRLSEDAAEGTTALAISVPEFGGRVGFGPVNLDRGAVPSPQIHLRFLAKSARPTKLTATLRSRARTLDQRTFVLSPSWQRFHSLFRINTRHEDDRREWSAAELIFDFAGDRVPEVNECGLDAVALTNSPIDFSGLRSAPVEIGILGLHPESGDLGHLIDERTKASVTIRLVGDSLAAPWGTSAASQPARTAEARFSVRRAGELAVDVLDAWDRPVGRLTRAISLPPSGTVIENVDLDGLTRGYYRIVASLWDGTPGSSTMISQATYPLGVISWSDAVPKDSPYGLSTSQGIVSAHTSRLGTRWVRMDLPTKELQTASTSWGFGVWAAMMGSCRANQVEAITALTLPADTQSRQAFVEQWLADGSLWPSGVLVRRPSITTQSTEAYLAELKWLGEQLARRAPGLRLVSDSLVDGRGGEGVVLGIACPMTPVPEECERQLEAIGHRQSPEQVVWDPCVPVRLGGAQPLGTSPVTLASLGRGAVQLLERPIDPVVSASHLVRSLLIRSLAVAQLSCSEALALDPVRSAFDDDCRRLHELDLSPRPALVAFDVLTELLNRGTLKRWVDVPGGTRVLYFEVSDGRGVAAVWRPYGMSPTRLALSGLGSSVTVMDCLGAVEPVVVEAACRVVEANEVVRFLIAADRDRPALQRSLEEIRVLLDTPNQVAR
ncbi:MAG TPA: hypothetical protein PKY77_02790 [Phycisphaerae bacterium]|nr:hypothetical protein [Phycisphaerae bacterium]HRY66672.1 hypothetical protein [Phycisphaerae bacterium]HSA27625.1 hypothetical protein [Phycisphaerae bacterium]